jgi:UDP-GlcNAc:undecaprenyl-phosphate GlcNAc-1-phosphate transferase
MKYILILLFTFVLSSIMVPLFRKIAVKLNFVDKPNERKIHKEPVPFAGGIAMFIAFTVSYIIFSPERGTKMLMVIAGSFLILGIGIVDDWYNSQGKDLRALPKFLVQVSAAILVYNAGIVFAGFHNPFKGVDVVLPEFLKFLFTIVWIFGVTTVINFSDGMDGLAGGLSAISATTLFIVALAKGQSDPAVMAIILVGTTIGFLRYNKYPARVFMGDAGATFLGFILAIIALDGAFKQATVLSIFIPVLALGVPIFDNIFVVLRRIAERKPIYKADRSQVHFRLLSTGLSQRQVVIFLYLVSVCLSLTSIIILLVRL